LRAANSRLERAGLSFASALVATLDARDRYTAGHSAAVAFYARDIAGRLGLSEDEQRLAHLCGLVHDIGKVGLPVGLLEKAGPTGLIGTQCLRTSPGFDSRRQLALSSTSLLWQPSKRSWPPQMMRIRTGLQSPPDGTKRLKSSSFESPPRVNPIPRSGRGAEAP